MPFTVSHIAAVLPLRGVRGAARNVFSNFPALAIGAMAPDFSYILGLVGLYFESHDLPGLFFGAWPMALLAYVLYQHWLEAPWVRLFPWLSSASFPQTLVSALVGTLLGAVTHLVWDAFTHRGGFFAETFPWLDLPVLEVMDRTFAVRSLLQHGCGLLGGLLLSVVVVRAVRKSPLRCFTRSWRTVGILALTWIAVSVAAALAPLTERLRETGREDVAVFWVSMAFRLLGSAALVAIGYAAVERFQRKAASNSAA